jgi:3-hydroxyisobutyrate dehydrogenase-like beta-hydroxyacid dehydrogenase
MKQPVIGFIGFGEAAFGITRGLIKSGLKEVNFYDKFWDKEPYGSLILKRASESGAILRKSIGKMMEVSDIIISCVTASVAIEVAESVVPYIGEKQIYVDVNAASPKVKEKIAKIMENAGAAFVDAAMMGPIPTYLHRVPILASGDGAIRFRNLMQEFDMSITCIGDKPGKASAIKMFRSIFMKGYVTILLETLQASHKYNADKIVLDSIAETMSKDAFIETARLLVTRGVIHAERRVHEMEEVIKTLKDLGVPYTMSKATKEKLKWCCDLGLKEYFKGEPPNTIAEVLEAIVERSQ